MPDRDRDLASFRTSADAYDRHVGRYGSALGCALLERAGVGRGQRVLDVGCGTGALTAELARVVGPESVAAVDPSPSFLERCRTRVPGVDVRSAMAEELPFGAGPAVVSAAYDGFDDLWQPFVAGVGPAGAHCASLGPDARESLRSRLFERLGAPAGAFELSARAWIVVGRTPSSPSA